MAATRAGRLRARLREPGLVVSPCCHDPLSARLIERAGFEMGFLSGFATSAARLGEPDVGLISYAEMAEAARGVCAATARLPIIGDGDTGYGNALNVARTVEGYAQAGLAGIMLEDQVMPKSCGHVRGKSVVGRAEAVSRMKAALDARDASAEKHGGDPILVVGRSDARQAVSFAEALWRVEAFADLGADLIFVDALESVEELAAFGAAAQKCGVPALANQLEGGGKTPLLSHAELEDLGFKIAAYPLSLLSASVQAMEGALASLRAGRAPEPPAILSFPELQDVLGFEEYFRKADAYANFADTYVAPTGEVSGVTVTAAGGGADRPAGGEDAAAVDAEFEKLRRDAQGAKAVEPKPEPGPAGEEEEAAASPAPVVVPEVLGVDASRGSLDEWLGVGEGASAEPSRSGSTALTRAEFLRVVVTSTVTGEPEVDVRLPTAVLGAGAASLKAALRAISGISDELLGPLSRSLDEAATTEPRDCSGTLLDVETGAYRIQVLED